VAGGPEVLHHTLSIGTIVALNGYILLLALPVHDLASLCNSSAVPPAALGAFSRL